jgi:hypothetical protein
VDSKRVVVAGLLVGIVYYAGMRIQVAVDKAGDTVLCLVESAGKEVPCDLRVRTYAGDRFMGRETDEGRVYEAGLLAKMPVPQLTTTSGGRAARIKAATWTACRKRAIPGAIYGAVNGAAGGALAGSAILGLAWAPGAAIGFVGGGVLGGASGCIWGMIEYSFDSVVDEVFR